MSQLTRFRLVLTSLAAVGAAVLVIGCSPPGAGDATTSHSDKPVGSISTDPAKAGPVTLTVWDQEVRGGQNAEITELNKQFEAKYPNVTIDRTSKSFADLKTTLKLALSGTHPPDVVEANQGYPDMVAFVKAGLLTPLDSYDSVYGWDKRYPKTLLDLNRVSDDGSRFGQGKLYGISQTGEYIGIYYNKAKLAALGISQPATWSDFTADLAKIHGAGQLPIQFGDLDKYPAIHEFGVIQDELAGKGTPSSLVFGTGNAAWTDANTVKAAATLQDWARNGYLTPGANGLGYDDAAKQFAAGNGVFLITGTWEAADLKGPMGSSLGLMPPPPMQIGAPIVTTGGEGLAFGITSRSAHADVAAAYLNFLTDAHADDVMTQTGNLPAVPGPATAALPSGGVDSEMAAGWKLVSGDGLVPYLDYSTPTFYDTLTAALQNLIGGQSTPEQFTQTLQADYSTFLHRR